VKGGLYWMQAALNLPLAPGARVLVGSSGAALQGSPLSGGYAGAKRMLWLMAKYANGVAEQKGLGIRIQAIVPQQMIGGTEVGETGASADARAMGLEPAAFLARFGAPMPPRQFGDHLVAVLDDPQYARGFAFGLKGDTGPGARRRASRREDGQRMSRAQVACPHGHLIACYARSDGKRRLG
jgi:hypothetical protein